ncbi:MAG TPA: response regulator transcription factor [Micromonosporaceae bacterium]
MAVLVCDRLAVMRAGIRAVLSAESDVEVVGEAADVPGAVGLASRLRPDIAVVESSLPSGGCRSLAQQLHEVLSTAAPRIIIVNDDRKDDPLAAISIGVCALVSRSQLDDTLGAVVRVIAHSEVILLPRPLISQLLWLAGDIQSASPGIIDQKGLTGREREVLILVAQALSNQEIAATLRITEATVRSHMQRLLHKLNLRDRAHIVSYAYSVGLVRPPTQG